MRRLAAARLCAAAACCAVAPLVGCSAASSPRNVAGVRAMYRDIGIDASSSNFGDICDTYMDEQLRRELEHVDKNCFSSRFEKWAEKVRLSKVTSATRIVVSGRQALVYDGATPERAAYLDGQWRLSEVPALSPAHGLLDR